MSNVTLARLLELKNRLELLKREAESAVSNVRCIVNRGNSVVSFQNSIQEVELFLKSYPIAGTEIDHLINTLVKLNCDLEITLAKRSDLCDVLSNFESNDSVFYDGDVLGGHAVCETCAKEKKTVGTNTDIAVDISEFDRETITKLYDVYEDSILEMKYLEGDDPSQFWLGFYSENKLLSHLAELKRKLELGELHRISTPVVGQFIIGHVNSVFRGCVISVVSGQVVAVDIDTSVFKLLNTHNIWEIGDSLSCFPPQAILCKLWNIEDITGWTTYLSTLFKNCIKKCNLVVTVKGIIPGIVPTFIVDLDAHDGDSLDVNMSEWINSFVSPAIERMKMFGLVGANEEAVIKDLDPYAVYRKDGSESDISTCVQNVIDLQEMEINSQVEELDSSVQIVESNCIIENLDETPVRDSNELIFNHDCANNETSVDCMSDNFVVKESDVVNQVNGRNSAEQSVKHVFQEQCDELEQEVLSESCQILKSSVVKCFVEKDRSLGMSFLRGTDPWNFFLTNVSSHEIDELKKKIAERAEIGLLIPLQNVPKIDDFAIGKCDNEYCRVRIIDVSVANKIGNVVVTDIDSGEMKLVSMTALWVLEEVFSLPPARAICCSLWNIPNNPSYWSFDLMNLFTNVMSRGPCCVNVKDVTYNSGKWTHHVQIQIFTDCVFDVSEWVMNFIFPNLKNIKQSYISGSDVDDVISKLDPNKIFRKEPTNNVTLQEMDDQFNSKVGKESLSSKSQTSEQITVLNKNSQILPYVKHFLANSLKQSNDFHFKKRSHTIQLNKTYFVFMSNIVNPTEFYIHLISEENSYIDKMQQDLLHYCSVGKIYFQNKKEAKQLIPECCAVYFKDQWFRGRIIDWFDNFSDQVSVFIVDYGILTTVSYHVIQPLRSDFYEYPVFAERCALAFISPPGNKDIWPESSVKFFSNILDYDTVYEIYVVNRVDSDIFCVFLFSRENVNVQCINDYLVEEGCAVSEIGDSNVNETENSHIPHYPITDSNVNETENSHIPHYPITDSNVNETENSHIVHYPIIDSGIDFSDSESIEDCGLPRNMETISYFDNSTAGLPDVGEQLTVVITEVINMGLFYGVPAKIQFEGRYQSTHQVLMNINNKISSAVQGGQLKLSKQLGEGAIVVARFSKDKKWYRARVLASPSETGYVEVFFVDYGNVDTVHKFYVREIRKDLCELPFQAMRLFIDNIDLTTLKDENAREVAQTLLTSLGGKYEVVINVTRVVNEDVEVQVMYEGRDIGEEMINLYNASC